MILVLVKTAFILQQANRRVNLLDPMVIVSNLVRKNR